jgi:hypothetical protein
MVGPIVVVLGFLLFTLGVIYIAIVRWVAPKSTQKLYGIWGSVASAILALIVGIPLGLVEDKQTKSYSPNPRIPRTRRY